MIKYLHVINDLGSGRKIWPVDWVYSFIGPDRKDKRARGAHFKEPVYLDGRGKIDQSLFKKGQKAGAEAQEKKCLIKCRTTDKILFLVKGAVL
jgi:hypothetical protein